MNPVAVRVADQRCGTRFIFKVYVAGLYLPAFYQVLLRIWLGDDPVQLDLKEALLGGVQ